MHEPIQFRKPGEQGSPAPRGRPPIPQHLDLKKDEALTIHWSDGRVSVYPVEYLRKMSPSAEARQLRDELARNPLTVLPGSTGGTTLRIEQVQRVGNYAVRLTFSDGHDTGLYSWQYLRQIDREPPETQAGADPDAEVRP